MGGGGRVYQIRRGKLMFSAAFKQQKQMVYGTLDSQEDLGRAIGQVINDVKSAEAVSPSFIPSALLQSLFHSPPLLPS